LEVRTKGFQGNLQKTARVFTNDPKNAQVIIGLKGEIWAPISLNPPYARLTGSVGDKIEQVVHLRGEKKEPLMVTLVSVSIPDKVEVQLKETEKGRSYELKVRNKVPTQGTYIGEIKLTTNYPENPEIVVRISGNIRPPLEVRPQALSFGRMSETRVEQLKKNGRSMTRSITVLLNKGNDLKIEKVESDKSLFKVVTKEVKPGRMVQLLVEPILGKLKTGPNADQLKIHTNQKQAQLLVVPISFEILQADEDSDTNQYNDDMDDDDVDEDDTDEDDDELGQMGSRIHFSLG
jgi:hypothetical protein